MELTSSGRSGILLFTGMVFMLGPVRADPRGLPLHSLTAQMLTKYFCEKLPESARFQSTVFGKDLAVVSADENVILLGGDGWR